MKKQAVFILAITIALAGAPMISSAQSTSAPTIPTGLTASLLQSGQIYITWNPSTSSSSFVGYYVYRNGQLVANTPGFLYFTDDAPAGNYTYTVAAYDSTGDTSSQSLPSADITVTQDSPPTAPTGLTLVPSSSSVTLSWNAATDNIAVIGYYIYRNGQKVITQDTIAGTTYTDTGLSTGYTYSYTVGAYNAQGYITRSPAMSVTTIFDVTPPSTPQNVKAKAVSSNEIDLSWSPSTDNVAVEGYSIYQNGQFFAMSNGTSTIFQNTGLTPGTLYSYYVVATDEVGNNSQQSIPVSALTPEPDMTPPSIPAGLRYVSPSTSEIDLSWLPSTDNVGVVGYNISRNGTALGSTAATTFSDTGLATGTTYQYFINAYDAANNTSPSQSIAATTLTSNPVVPVVPTPPVAPTQPVTPPPTPPTNPVSTGGSTTPTYTFTTLLYLGLRGVVVTNLQNVLIAQGDLAPQYATGYFGSLTQKAVQAFQCAHAIVCSGSPYTTGYGQVGMRTRAALNAL